ncbi:unnamed protein product [Paramecium sonneborni]|uniref:Uncharacterized protein n=1 Tax=Paramecium sonneborni TaxID=65129 RepID=A0A8S1QD05_9CILI|nr:unnamed protein product [Paramecium sonneborni]
MEGKRSWRFEILKILANKQYQIIDEIGQNWQSHSKSLHYTIRTILQISLTQNCLQNMDLDMLLMLLMNKQRFGNYVSDLPIQKKQKDLKQNFKRLMIIIKWSQNQKKNKSQFNKQYYIQ